MKKLFNATVVYPEKGELKELADSVSESEIEELIAKNKGFYIIDCELIDLQNR